MMTTTRRDFLSAALAFGLPHASFAAEAAPELLPIACLHGDERLDAAPLRIEGRLPAGLRGSYFRNGPGLMARGGERYRHWFDGDGFVQALRFDGEGRVSHRGRFVQTAKLKAEAREGRFLVPAFGTAIPPRVPLRNADSMNVANTSVLQQAGRLYALWEGGSAYELDPATLETLGPRAWTPELAGMPFSAHPKQEPDGTSWNFGTSGKQMVVYRISAAGAVVNSAVFEIPPTAMVHDFAVSQRYLVFLLAPLTLDMAALREGRASMVDAMQWHGDAPTRVLIVDKRDLSRRRILEMPATFVFHFGNAWDEGDVIRLDFVKGEALPLINERLQAIMRGERPETHPSTPRFMRIELAGGGRISIEARDESVEFPVVDPRVVAQRYGQVFYPTAIDLGPRWGFNGLMKLDVETGRRERFAFGADTVVEEHVLVPKPGSSREGEGWLLGMGYDTRHRRSFASVFDAQHLADGPLARIWLPYTVPYGFHGRFYAA
ncbi:carotenoid oxygenase family protein [Pelomonas sp. KK5]|uniref:carotenoid oxygenase family protein n=1 Tax=Pelomonas sp. KK5 TaxID=1855730 RepID=UPI0009FB7B72|nr:carotenoid oxygenase family protein [Pelomonas sp. KK5]